MNKIYFLKSFLFCSFCTFILFTDLLHAQFSYSAPLYNYSYSNFNALSVRKSFLSAKDLPFISIKKENNASKVRANTNFACPTITDSITRRQNVTCVSGNNGVFQFEGKGGVAPYTYTLSTISGDVTNTTGLFENLVAKEYRLKITDNNGCFGTFIHKIESFTDLNTLNNSMLSYDWLADSVASSASNTYTYLTGASPALKVNDDSLAQYGAGNLNAISKFIPIGFSFKMDNFYYDSLVIAEDGVVSFNKNINTSNYSLNQWYQNIFYTGLNTYASPITGESCQCDTAYLDNALPFIAPLRDDIQPNATGAVPSQIVYKLSGTAPNRIFTVEWRNMRWNRVCNVQRDNSVSFQMELFEGTNNVKFHYKAEPNLKLDNCGGDYMGDFSSVVGYDYSAGLFGRKLGGGNYIALNPDSTKLFTNAPNVVTDAGGTTLYRGVKTDNRNFPSAIGYPYGKHYEFISPATGPCVDPLSIVSVQTTPSSGSNGMITITATGGLRKSSRYFYSKDGGKTYREGSIPASGMVYQDTFKNLAPGTYRIAVMDNQIFQISESGTPISQSFIIQTVEIPVLKIDSLIDKNISCNGLSDGELTFKWTKTSPTGTYDVRFEKSDGTGVQTFTGITDTIKQFTGLNANTYKITVTFNDYGSSVTATETLTNPSNVTFTSAPTTAPTCFGGSDGGIVINVAGGTSPYMYSIDNGSSFQASEIFTGLMSGSFTLKAKDVNGCLAVTSPTVNVPNGLQVTIFSLAKNNADCKGTSTGDIFIKPGNGTRPFSYSSDNGATFQVDSFFKNIPAAVYPLKIKDANGCLSTTTNLNIDEPTDFLTFSTSNTNISCANPTASITVTASGGTSVYQFSSDNGASFTNSSSTPNPYTFSSLTAGTYKIKVRDANGCLAGPTDVTLNGVTSPIITFNSKIDVRCYGSQTGVLNITVSGGASPYSVVVKNSLNTVISGTGSNPYNYPDLAADTYTITVTDGNSCVTTQTVTITQPALFYATVSGTDVSCNGGTNGVINLTANGGVSPYQFSKDNGTTYVSTMTSSNTFTGLPAATYLLKVKDANNCIGSTGKVISEPSAISVSINAQTNVLCHGTSTGAVTLLASGGNNSSYTYKKDASTFNTTGIFTGLAMGTYVFTVTDGNNCEMTKSVVITEPPPLSIGTVNTTAATCSTGGTVIVTGTSGGIGTYTFKLTVSLSNTTGNFTNIAGGNYTLTVTDDNGCEKTTTVNVANSSAPTVNVTAPAPILCQGGLTGTFTFSVLGGTGTYTVEVKNALNNLVSTMGSNPYTASSLGAGTYNISVTDGASCSVTESVTITEPSALNVSINAQTNVLCHGASTGAVTLLASGGNNSSYTYKKDASTSNTTGIFTGLSMGTYVFTVTDGNNCEVTKSVTITEPSALNVSINAQTNILCHGASTGAVTLLASGGNNSSYTYKKDASTSNTTGIFTGLSMGTYVFTVTDGNNCEVTKSVTITEPSALNVSINAQTNILCHGASTGAVTLLASGGNNSSYTYKKDASTSNTTGIFTGLSMGTYVFTVTDGNNCEATKSVTITEPTPLSIGTVNTTSATCITGGTVTVTGTSGGNGTYTFKLTALLSNTTGSFTNIAGGNYTLTLTDDNGCEKTTAVNVSNSSAPIVNVTATTPISCHGGVTGMFTFSISGGTGSYTVLVKDGSNNTVSTTGSNPYMASSLGAGTYSISVTDGASCSVTESVTITEPSALSVSVNSQTNVLCHGASTGAVTLLASGGNNSTYTYKKDASTFNTTGIFTGLAMGTYVFTVTDGNNCEATKSVTITEPSALSVSINSQTNVLCHGASIGAVTLLASGGNNSSYTYKKDASTFNTTGVFTGLAMGTYVFTVTDGNNCEVTKSVTITEPTPLSISNTKIDVTVNGGSNGKITVTASGGTGALQFSKDDGANYTAGTSPFDFTGLSAGVFKTKVKDASNCESETKTVEILEPTSLSITSDVKDVTCNNGTNGEIKLTISGGVAPYEFSKDDGANYSPEANPFTFSGLAATTYLIKVKDANGATASKSIIVNQPPPLSISVDSKQDKDCTHATGSVTLAVSGGTGALKVSLDGMTFQDALTFNTLTDGGYTATVKDANNCTQITTFNIANNGTPPIKPDAIADKTACNGETVKLTPNAVGITSFKFYAQDPTGGGVTPLSTGATYTFNLTETVKIWITSVNSLCESAPISTTITAYNCEIIPSISDPCVCKNNATTLTNGQFDEMVEVSAPAGQTWTVSAINGLFLTSSTAPPAAPTAIPIGTMLTYDAMTGHYQLLGVHVDGVGYSISVTNGAGTTLSISNKCWYPEPMITVPLSISACSSDAVITLAGNAQLGDGTGAAMGIGSFTVDNMSATTINPATIGVGTHTIIYTFDATDNVPSAHPGCVQAVSQTIEILSTPVISSVVTPPSCVGSSDGAIDITVVGTTSPYTFKWSNNAVTEDLIGLTAGNYSVTVTDKNMCTAELKDIEVKTNNTLPTVISVASLFDNNTTGQCGKIITYNSSSTGTPAPTITYEFQGATIASGSGNGSGLFFNVGTTKVILSATNSCGVGTYTFNVTINDTEKPKITCPSPITVNNDLGLCSAKVTFNNATATDNCSATVTLTSLLASGSTFPVGESTVSFKATDAANNSSTCNFKITVEDVEKPKITCPVNQNITLGSFECSRVVLFADPSVSDNCSATFKRTDALMSYTSGTSFGAGIYPLSYQATDAAMNTADCKFTIQVNGQLTSGRLKCLPTLTIALDDRQCINILDGPSLLIDNTYYCASYYTTSIPNRTNNYITSADLGKTLTVTVSDNFNNSCSTLVTVVDTKAPVLNAPQDTIINCADLSRNGDILPNLSLPIIIYECSKTTFTYIDKILTAPNGQTFSTRPDGFPADKNFNLTSAYNSAKIVIRTYTATDAFNNSSTIQRVIYVRNVELYLIECPKDVVVSCAQGNFNTSIESTGTPFIKNGRSLLDASCAIDYFYFDEKTDNNQGYILKRTWTLVDRNTQERKTCVQNITVNDTKPTITCSINKTISIAADKKAVILPIDIATASDNCTPQNALIWSITEGVNSNTSSTYTCADLGSKTVQISVKDAGGNTSNCTTTVKIVDNNDYCVNIPLLSLSGAINRESGENVTATVRIYNPTDSIGGTQASSYLFNNLLSGGSYRVRAERDNDVSNGVTTFDIALISKHVLDLQPFTSPYQMIAADVNRDGEIDGADMLLIRNLVLRRISRFPNNMAWRFIPKNYAFRDNKNPFTDDFPEVLNFNNLTENVNKADFIAVKVGDVNLSARADLNALAVRNSKPVENIYLTDKKLEVGKEYVFDLKIKNTALLALQLALKIDKNRVESFKIGEGDLPQFEKGNFEVYEKEGVTSIAWANPKKEILNSENSIIKISIKARESAWLHELLSLNAAFMDNFAYNTEGVEHNIELRFKANTVDKTEFELYQNFPNPFKEETVISFMLPEEGSAELSIVDLAGREVFTTRRTFSKGYNEVRFNYEELKASGVYLYRLKTDKNVALKRMLYIKN